MRGLCEKKRHENTHTHTHTHTGLAGWFGSVGLVGLVGLFVCWLVGWLCEVFMTSLDFLKIDG